LMNSDKTFLKCLVVSLTVHLFFFCGVPAIRRATRRPSRKVPIEITYLMPVTAKAKLGKTNKVSKAVLKKQPLVKKTDKVSKPEKDTVSVAKRAKTVKSRKEETKLVKPEELSKSQKEQHHEKAHEIDLDKLSASDEFVDYYEAITAKIKSVVIYPPEASSRGLEGAARLRFSIDLTGELIAVKLVNSAQNNALDWAALKSIKEASPFPPFPEELKSKFKHLSFNTKVTFQLN